MKKRISTIEALRVVSMLLIVVSHYIYHGLKETGLYATFDVSTIDGMFDYITMEPLYILSCVAVNCYVMITGYFMIDKFEYRWKGMARTWIQTFFYSIFLWLFARLGWNDSLVSPVKLLFPVYSNEYWFITSYIGLMLVSPLLSITVKSVSKKTYQLILLVLFIVNFQFLYGGVWGGFETISWFSYLFLVAGYVKLYGIPHKLEEHRLLFFWCIWILLFVLATAVNVSHEGAFSLISTAYNGPVFFLSFAFFILFEKAKSGKLLDLLSRLAPYTLGIYLIHEHPCIRKVLWEIIVPESFCAPMVIYLLISCILLFFICALIDYLRSLLFRLLRINEAIDYLSNKLPQIELNER